MLAQNIMTSHPVCVTSRTRLADAIAIMYANDVRHVPVLDDQNLVGILSDRDLRPLWDAALDPASDRRLHAHRVGDYMSSSPVTVDAETEIDEVIEQLLEHRVGALPVVNAEGTLIGIVSYVDVLRAAHGRF